jgi:chromosome segregation ATPase
VESTIPSTRIETSYGINELSERGYTLVYFDELNKYYIHKLHSELIPSFKYGPNIFDDFIRAEHKASRDQAEALDRDLTERTKELVGTRSVLEERTELLKKSREDLAEHEKVLKELTQKFEIANKEIESLSHGLNKERKAHNALRGMIENISQQLSETEKENLVAFAANPFLYFIASARIKKLFRKINVSIKKRI